MLISTIYHKFYFFKSFNKTNHSVHADRAFVVLRQFDRWRRRDFSFRRGDYPFGWGYYPFRSTRFLGSGNVNRCRFRLVYFFELGRFQVDLLLVGNEVLDFSVVWSLVKIYELIILENKHISFYLRKSTFLH